MERLSILNLICSIESFLFYISKGLTAFEAVFCFSFNRTLMVKKVEYSFLFQKMFSIRTNSVRLLFTELCVFIEIISFLSGRCTIIIYGVNALIIIVFNKFSY